MIPQNENAQLNRMGVILYKNLFPQGMDEIITGHGSNYGSNLTKICDMLHAAYDKGYADRVREEIELRPYRCFDNYHPVDMGPTDEKVRQIIEETLRDIESSRTKYEEEEE